jgi:hypothetical protein
MLEANRPYDRPSAGNHFSDFLYSLKLGSIILWKTDGLACGNATDTSFSDLDASLCFAPQMGLVGMADLLHPA